MKFAPYLLAFLIALGASSCSPSLQLEGDPQLIETEVGTNVGNPSIPSSSLNVAFKSKSIDEVDLKEALCKNIEGPHGRRTYSKCPLTPKLELGVMQMHALNCPDLSCADSLEKIQNDLSLKIQTPLYQGSLVAMTLSEDAVTFPEPLLPFITDEVKEVTGMHLLLAYIDFTLPQTEKVAEHLRGIECRICLTDKDTLNDAVAMKEFCHHSEAKRGAMLCDINHDGDFGFINQESIGPDFVEEIVNIPNQYIAYQETAMHAALESLLKKNLELNVINGASAQPYSSFIMPLKSRRTLAPGNNYNFLITFDPHNSLYFFDSWREPIVGPDLDAEHVYNIYYDGLVLFKLQVPELSLLEK